MSDRPSLPLEDPASEPALARTLAAAGVQSTGRFRVKAGWVSRAWIGEEHVVRVHADPRFRGAYRHEARVADLLAGTAVPHARHIAHGEGPDGCWYVSARLPGRTLHEAWPTADLASRRTMIESLGAALRALHRTEVPPDLRPPWLSDALAGGEWPAYHPPIVDAAQQRAEAAARVPGHDPRLLADVTEWIHERRGSFAVDDAALVHGDLHGSNILIDRGRVTGLIDFAEAVAQPADLELDTLLRWCARPQEFPPTPAGHGLEATALAELPGWLRGAYPELFAGEHLRERLALYDMTVELAIHAHHPQPEVRAVAQQRIALLLDGRGHLDALSW